MKQQYIEHFNETLLELERSRERERLITEENQVILAALSALSRADNKYQIFDELKKVLSRYIKFNDFIVISKGKDSTSYSTFLTSNIAFTGKNWLNGTKFQRVLDGESIILFEPIKLDEFKYLNSFLKNQIESALITGIRTQTSDSVLLLLGKKKGQFSLDMKTTLLRFRPLLERAISDIEYKEELQRLVDIKTKELVVAQQLAEQANKSKSQFLAMMSHELRTPLNAVLGLIDVLRDTSNIHQLDLLEQMEHSAELLLVIINDVLDLSRIESGHFKLQCHKVNLYHKLNHALEYHRQLAEDKGIAFCVDVKLCPTTEYLVDPVRLTQILFNVVGNAVKFTEKGMVTVSLYDLGGKLNIQVNDTGIGIESDRVEQLFSPFIQADSSHTRNYGGTGLGLTITKHLVELMKGTISVSSTLHKGSCFEITIPLKDSCMDVHKGTITNAAIKKNEEKTYNILVVEDTKTNQIVIQLMLSRLGYNVTLADNGKQAVELIKNDEQFDLIFMDISMPVMDGIEATKQIRAKSLSVPIIALTAHTMDDDKDECLKAGMNEFMLKPMRINEISSVIERFTA
ncbi:signal transduction histidine kinase [Vibrio diazotrophicus]|jgi:signal transduction histidine kinase/ActR/RegA family two-component response regulator|uniref:histidine kinase n=1 Tax=Vibrio diazotrophicus TaxID=685 RepID=A0A2J8GN22_VIBDI|nr:response regulator [Vibrio diazotrophicus]PNH87373.1 hybrid sensor histidine kinase/response regulator [Vibrio diazotrophicus]RAS61381.1 signal transduction histidine kinase [Vibrio diazotrophicus]